MQTEIDLESDSEALQALYAQTLYALRESRKALLRQYAVDGEAQLLEKIKTGELAEHPAYERYLSALIIEQTRMLIRAQAVAQLGGYMTDDVPEPSVHLLLQEKIQAHYAARLSEPVRLAQDALLLSFDSGLTVEARYVNRNEYSISWSWGEAELRIDTAPVHADCATHPRHFHDDSGQQRADPLTLQDDCWLNFSRLIDTLLVDPLLEGGRPAC